MNNPKTSSLHYNKMKLRTILRIKLNAYFANTEVHKRKFNKLDCTTEFYCQYSLTDENSKPH